MSLVDGLPVWLDYAGTGGHRVVFRRAVVPGGALTLPERGHGEPESRDEHDQILAY